MPPRQPPSRRYSSSGSECSDRSDRSASTAPTIFSDRPALRRRDADISAYVTEKWTQQEAYFPPSSDGRESVATYASTVPSEADFDEEDYPEHPVYEEPLDYRHEAFEPTAVPSTPPEFAEYFPSTRRLCIRHDDTYDGNMNLRVDTEIERSKGRRVDLTLFHLRMHDLKNRQFSLRRYCRESGREVCHSSRKYTKPASERKPILQRSMSSALATLRPRSSDSKASMRSSLRRIDSGYDSMSEDDDESVDSEHDSRRPSALPVPTNTTNIEFSNYAHLELKRRGTKGSKRYDFEYWGTSYQWRRVTRRTSGEGKQTTYNLYGNGAIKPIAHIVPVPMTPEEAEEESAKGGWIPPSNMWISDSRVLGGLTDVADVIVTTGLMALVDDTIKQRWHRKDRFHFTVPLPSISSKLNMEYVGPKRLIDEVFNRRGHDTPKQSGLREVAAKT